MVKKRVVIYSVLILFVIILSFLMFLIKTGFLSDDHYRFLCEEQKCDGNSGSCIPEKVYGNCKSDILLKYLRGY